MLDLLNSLFSALAPLGEMSLTAAYAAAIVAVLRLVLKKRAPRRVVCLLWLVVFARLLVPVSLESPLSIVPDAQQVQLTQGLSPEPEDGTQTAPVQNPAQDHEPAQSPAQVQAPGGAAVIPAANTQTGPVLTVPGGVTPTGPKPEAPASSPWQAVLAGVWLAGALAMCGYGLLSWFGLRRRLYDAIRADDGAWEHPSVNSPFILGVFRPRIYLPAGLYGQPRRFILCHERAHLRRLDHVVKPVCWVALALHWFNPAVWLAYILMSRDIEAACDEAVIRQLGPKVKADYSATLLSLATNGRVPAPCPLAFDEGNAKGRIKNVLSYRRPALWVVVVSVLAALLAAVCLLTDPVSAKDPEDPGPGPSASQDLDPSQPPEDGLTDRLLDPWMKEVLDGERTFADAYSGRTIDIHHLSDAFGGEFNITLSRLAVIDLDKDGLAELVLWPSVDGDDSIEQVSIPGYLILRRQGDAVYWYNPSFRAFAYLKEDGTFDWSGGAADWGIGSAQFTEDGFEIHDITWCASTNDLGKELYFVDGLKATQEEFESAIAAHHAKPDVTWYILYDGALYPCAIALPIPLDENDLSVPVPDFLDAGQQLLYRQTYAMYRHIFGANTEEVEAWPARYGYQREDAVPLNGMSYVPATGRYGHWDDFEEAVLSVFSRDFWNERNHATIGDGTGFPLYTDLNGRLHYIAAARGTHGYNYNFPVTFRLTERTDDTISFVVTGYYSETFPLEGESIEERDARLAAGYEYTIDFPMRLVRTEGGWRFDEFYCAYTDNYRAPFDGQHVPNPDAPALPSPTPSPTPEPTLEPTAEPSPAPTVCRHGLDYVWLEYAGSRLVARCSQCDFIYPVPGVTSANFDGQTGESDGSGWVREDLDGDDNTEVVVYTTDHKIVSLKVVNEALVTSSFDLQTLVNDFNQNATSEFVDGEQALDFSYRGQTVRATFNDGDWTYFTTHGGSTYPEIWLTDYWVNRILGSFRVHSMRGLDFGFNLYWSLSYSADGRLQLDQLNLNQHSA